MKKPSALLLYFSASLFAALFVIYQVFSKDHISFSLAFTRLTSSRLNNVILGNCLFAFLLVTTTTMIKFFFGEMREIERYDIIQWTKQKVLSFAFMTVVLHDNLITSQLMVLFVGILAWSIFHWLAIKRSEYLIMENQSNHIGHIKISVLFLSLAIVDFALLKMFYEAIFVNQNLPKTDTHLIILIAFEVLILLLKIGSPLLKYFVNLIELLTLSHFEHKSTLLSVAEFFFTITALISELLFFYFIYQTFGTPLHLILEAIETIMSLVKTTTKFYSSIALVRKLNKLPDITEEDIKNIDSTCLICLHEITNGKKIPCGHIFHLSCLKGWIQGNVNQFCPKCKQPIKIDLGASAGAEHDHVDPLNPMNHLQQQQQQQQANIQNLHNKVEKLGYLNFGLENVMVMKLYNEIQLNYIDKDEDQFKSYQDIIRRIYSDILNATEEEKEQIGALEYGLPRPAVSYRSAEIDDLRKKSKLVNYLLLSQFGNHQFFKLKPNEPIPKPAEEKEETPKQATVQQKPVLPQPKSDLSTILKKGPVQPVQPEQPKEGVTLNQTGIAPAPTEEKKAPVQKEETEEDAIRRRRLLLEAAEKRFQNPGEEDEGKSQPLPDTKKTQ